MNIPFNFVLDHLFPLEVKTKPMFGMFALYLGDKLILMLRESSKNPQNNGVWVATNGLHHESLRQDFPTLKSINGIIGKVNESKWQLLAAADDDFEESVSRVCELIKKNDPRIGKITK